MEKALLEIEYRERRHLGYELHDSLGQLIAGISLKTQNLERNLKDNKIPNVEAVAKINLLIGQAKKQVRLLTKGILPIEIDTEDLIPALKSLASDTTELFNVSSVLICDKPFLISNKIAVAQLYRIAQEAVMNAVKHGNPENIEINLSKKSDKVVLSIMDDGKGFQKSTEQTNGIGLQIMNYRANMIDASLDIKSDINKGTSVTCIFYYKTRDKK
jgi:signal transduction histidine kinase